MMLRYKGTYSARNLQIKKPLSSQTATFKLVVTKTITENGKIELSKYLSSNLYSSRLCPYSQCLARCIAHCVNSMVERIYWLVRHITVAVSFPLVRQQFLA